MGNQQSHHFNKQIVYQDNGKYIIPTKIKASQTTIQQNRVSNIFGLNDPTLLARSYWANSQHNAQTHQNNQKIALSNQQICIDQSNFNVLSNITNKDSQKYKQSRKINYQKNNKFNQIIDAKTKIHPFNQETFQLLNNHHLSKVTSHSIISKLNRFEDENQQYERQKSSRYIKNGNNHNQFCLNKCQSQYFNGQNVTKSRRNLSTSKINHNNSQSKIQEAIDTNNRKKYSLSNNKDVKKKDIIQCKISHLENSNNQEKLQKIFGYGKNSQNSLDKSKINTVRSKVDTNNNQNFINQDKQQKSCQILSQFRKSEIQNINQTKKQQYSQFQPKQHYQINRTKNQICQQTFANHEQTIIVTENSNHDDSQLNPNKTAKSHKQSVKSKKSSKTDDKNYFRKMDILNFYKDNRQSLNNKEQAQTVKSNSNKTHANNRKNQPSSARKSNKSKSINLTQRQNTSQIFNENIKAQQKSQKRTYKIQCQQNKTSFSYQNDFNNKKSQNSQNSVNINDISPVIFLKLQKVQIQSSNHLNQQQVPSERSKKNYKINLVIDNENFDRHSQNDQLININVNKLQNSNLTDCFKKYNPKQNSYINYSQIKRGKRQTQSSPEFQRKKPHKKYQQTVISKQSIKDSSKQYKQPLNKKNLKIQNQEESFNSQNKYHQIQQYVQTQKNDQSGRDDLVGFLRKSPRSMVSDQDYRKKDRSHSGRIVQTSKAAKSGSSPFKSKNFNCKQNYNKSSFRDQASSQQNVQNIKNGITISSNTSKSNNLAVFNQLSLNRFIEESKVTKVGNPQKLLQKITSLEQELQRMKQQQRLKQFESRRYSPVKQQRNFMKHDEEHMLSQSNHLITKHRKQYFKLKLN